mgnify:CR=1 FL=1
MIRRYLLPALLWPALALAQKPSSVADLLSALATAPNEAAAAQIENRIAALWAAQPTPAVALLMASGVRAGEAGNWREAIEDFTAALDLQPELPEALRLRAQARFQSGDDAGAIADLEAALRAEPRDFLAFRDLAAIAEARGNWKGAYAAWRKLLEIDPHTPGGAGRLNDLRRRALGEEM